LGIATEVSSEVQIVEALLVMSCVEPSLKVPTAWNCKVTPVVGAAATTVGAQVGSIGVGLGTADEVGIGVGEGGAPGQIEMLCRDGPGGPGRPQTVVPVMVVTHWTGEPPPPQLHEKATATNIIAAPIKIHRALPIIANQL
jgi:hypothetical protein